MSINQRLLPTPEMIRAARGYLDWSQQELGRRCDLSKVSLVGIENGRQFPNHQTLKRIATSFWDEGIIFLPEGGFRVENSLIKIFEGAEGIKGFFNDVYITAREQGGEFLVSGVNEEDFISARENAGLDNVYREQMAKTKVHFKILISESDENMIPAVYGEYRSIPEKYFSSNVPFYIYGKKVAIIIWGETPKIIVIKDESLVYAHEKQFQFMWKNAVPKEIK